MQQHYWLPETIFDKLNNYLQRDLVYFSEFFNESYSEEVHGEGCVPDLLCFFSANNLGFLRDFGEINFYFPKTISPG